MMANRNRFRRVNSPAPGADPQTHTPEPSSGERDEVTTERLADPPAEEGFGAYPSAAPLLARIMPQGVVRHFGLYARFAELARLAEYLVASEVDAALVVLVAGNPSAIALTFEGRLVAANAISDAEADNLWGERALIEFAQRYEDGAELEVIELKRPIVHALCGLGERAWRVQPGEQFTGVRLDRQAVLLSDGEVVATVALDLSLPYVWPSGAFPSPLRPLTLTLPRVVGPWANERYTFTLRGRDAVNPITEVHVRVRAAHSKAGLEVLSRLGRGQTPLEAAVMLEREVTELEPLISAFIREGLLRRRTDPES